LEIPVNVSTSFQDVVSIPKKPGNLNGKAIIELDILTVFMGSLSIK